GRTACCCASARPAPPSSRSRRSPSPSCTWPGRLRRCGLGKTPADRGPPPRVARTATDADLPLKDGYRPADVGALDYARDLGAPGEFPFTRGVQRTMYRGRLWTMRQYAGFGTAQASNERYRYLLAQGQTGLSIAFDLPTQMGRDADHPLARGEVGKT